jgi:hypothetical protein
MRIGFLYNHDQIHQIAHSLPVALALAESGGADVILAATNPQIVAEIQRIAGPARLRSLTLVRLDLSRRSSIVASRLLNRVVPARKLLVLRDNIDFFRSLDALVLTERTSLILRNRYGLTSPKFILIDHGAGDRAIGFGPELAQFDHILAAGPKIRDRMIGEARVDPRRATIVGYPKFDIGPPEPLLLPMLQNGRPTVVYNPHPSPHLSSWYAMGRRVLDYFYRSDRYNLIFAPHVMLFHRSLIVSIDRLRIARSGRIPLKYFMAPHIHIDLGSRFSTDMSYTATADLYLGDVSSQVYEFLRHRRPCLFLNAHKIRHAGDPNFAHWRTGQVIDSATDLDDALGKAPDLQRDVYRPIQDALFDYTFDLRETPSSARAAQAIRTIVTG